VTIPTTSNAITETPANTPNPIGNTCSFFPGGSTNDGAPAFSEFATGVGVGPDEGDGEPPTSGRGPVGSIVLPGCVVPVGIGTEETPITTTGTAGLGATKLLVPVLSGSGDTELLPPSRMVVSVPERAGGRADTELAGGKLVIVESGGTVLEERSVLDGRPAVLKGTSVGVEESVSLVLVKVGGRADVEDGNPVDTVELDSGGGRALETSPLPLSGVITHVFSSLTISALPTTTAVRVIVHV